MDSREGNKHRRRAKNTLICVQEYLQKEKSNAKGHNDENCNSKELV